jgi:hypothetical protein
MLASCLVIICFRKQNLDATSTVFAGFTYTTPPHGRTTELHTAGHVSVFAELSTHGGGSTICSAAITTEIRTVTANTIFTAATS